jgi:hypothetical protein
LERGNGGERRSGGREVWSSVFSEVPFWNSVECGILYGIDFRTRNSAKKFTVKYHGIRYWFLYVEFCISSNENSIIQPITKNL